MSNKPRTRKLAAFAAGATVILGASGAFAAAPGATKGPTTSTDPYVIPIDAAKVQITSLLTVDEAQTNAPNYVVSGIPDGMGVYADGSGSYTLLSNHELGNTVGAVRSNGKNGAFVSRFSIDPSTLAVSAGADLIPNAAALDYSGTPATAFGRFCSGDLAESEELYNTVSGNGYNGKIFFAGEETGLEGRLVGHDAVTGDAKVLTGPGWLSWENFVLANTATSDTVLAFGANDSSAAGQNFNLLYVGTKTNTGSKWDKAGLTSGTRYAMKMASVTTDAAYRTAFGKNNPQPFTLVAVTGATGTALQASALAQGALGMDRTEDGAWDPSNPNDFYYVTTGTTNAALPGRGGLWRMRWVDRTNPTLGGSLELLADGLEAAPMYMPDNLTVDASGHVVIQEDPGGNNYIARIWAYDIATKALAPIATFDPAQFTPATPGFITNDEESSGIIEAPSAFGANTFLFNAQVHSATGLSNVATQVERGQYMAMKVDWAKVFPTAPPVEIPEVPYSVLLPLSAVFLGGGMVMIRRRRAAPVA